MGLFTIAVVAASRSNSSSRRAVAAEVKADWRKRQRKTAAPLFRESPTRKEVAQYLLTQYHVSSPQRAAAIDIQLTQLRAGYPFEVTANPSTGSIRVRLDVPTTRRPRPNPYAQQAAEIQARLDANPLLPEWRRNPETWTTQQEIDYNHHVYMAEREAKRRQIQKRKERDERDQAAAKKLR